MFEICPRCGSEKLKRQTGNEEPTSHYGRLLCGDCGRFIKWLRDPDVCVSHFNRKQNIDSMLATANLNEWERDFLRNIYDRRVLTPKQQNTYESIWQKITPNLLSRRGESVR